LKRFQIPEESDDYCLVESTDEGKIVLFVFYDAFKLLSLATTKPLHSTDVLYDLVGSSSRIPKLVIVPKVRFVVNTSAIDSSELNPHTNFACVL